MNGRGEELVPTYAADLQMRAESPGTVTDRNAVSLKVRVTALLSAGFGGKGLGQFAVLSFDRRKRGRTFRAVDV